MRVPLIRSSSVAIKDFCLYGGSNLWDVIRHMLVVRESSETRRNAFEVYKVFAFASPHICVLCVVGDTSLPQTSCSGCVVCVWAFASACVCVRARLSSNTHICILYMSEKFSSFHPSCCHRVLQTSKNKEVLCCGGWLVQGLGGGVGLCCRFMWHRQNITRCRCNHAVCFALRYCSNKGCDGKARKCLSPSPLKFSLSTFSSNNPSLQPVSEPSQRKTVHTQKHSSGTRACEERSTNNRHEA